jgi:prophage tail gpP-like protein
MTAITLPSEQVRLVADGREFAGWQEITIDASLEAIARSFRVAARARWPRELHAFRVRPGSAVKVYVGGDLVITGWIDKLEASFDATSHTIAVTGRSRTSDLVDCSAVNDPGHWRARTALQIATDLAAPYGVEVLEDVNVGEPIPRFALSDGETVGAALQRLAALRSLLVTDDALGRVRLTRAGSTRAAVALVVGENVVEGSSSVDVSGRFTEYRCKSQRIGDDQDFGAVLQTSQGADDGGDLGRVRILEISAEGGEDAARARQRAEWEAATRYGQSIGASYNVRGWRQGAAGALWAPNQIVTVRDDLGGIRGDLLVVDVSLTVGGNGTRAALTLAPPEGFELLAPAAPRRRGGAKARPVNTQFDALADGVKAP